MKIKTFVSTYILFLLILFASVGIVSAYLTNSQVNILKSKSAGQFEAITHSLFRDISVVWGRGIERGDALNNIVTELVQSYARYYRRHNVDLSISIRDMETEIDSDMYSAITFANYEGRYYIHVVGLMPMFFDQFILHYTLDITQNIAEMREIQNVLLISAIVLSIIAAFALYLILSSIFLPLSVIAKTSREIASGQFGQRMSISGKNELAQVAYDFNKMAERIESQIAYLEEEAENKQQFVDNFAHEIRTPLTSIYGYAEYMQKAALDTEEIIECATYITDEALYMKSIASSLLDLATLRNYTPIMDTILIERLFDDVVQSMKKLMQEKNIAVSCEILDDVECITGQEDLIKSLLVNLCTNAYKSCAKATGVVTLRAERLHAGNNNYVAGMDLNSISMQGGKFKSLDTSQSNSTFAGTGIKISVIDNGHGIAKEDLPKVMESFYRVDKSRNRECGGIGLGLTLCNRIAQVHGTKMEIASVLGEGTTAYVVFTTC